MQDLASGAYCSLVDAQFAGVPLTWDTKEWLETQIKHISTSRLDLFKIKIAVPGGCSSFLVDVAKNSGTE